MSANYCDCGMRYEGDFCPRCFAPQAAAEAIVAELVNLREAIEALTAALSAKEKL